MKSKLIKFIISGLLIILSITLIFTYNNYKNHQLKIQEAINTKTKVEQTFKIIDKQTVVDKLNLEDSLNCLSGEVTVNENFTNNTISGQDVSMNFLKQWFNNSTSKDLNVSNTYKFNFSYDLKDIPVNIHNSTITIHLSYNRLSLNSIESIKTDASERVGWLTSQFTPQQVNALNNRVKDEAMNTVQSNETYRVQAMENIQGDIKDLLQGVIGKDTNIHFEISNYDVVQQDVATIVNK
jgi:hypothetical protein